MQSKKRATHRDVARLAGVSTAAVSYVINNGPRPTSPEVRQRVLQAIHELDYHPNAVARGLRSRRTNTIGYIVNDYSPLDLFVSPYSAGILTGLTAQLTANEHFVLVHPMGIGESLAPIEQLLRSGRIDGIVVRLVQDPPETDALMELIASTQVPCVCLERPAHARFGFSAVTYDDAQGSFDAVSMLIARGHRRIGHISGDQRYASARARLDGYTRALRSSRREVDPALIVGDDWEPSTARRAVEHFLGLDDPPTAIAASNDTHAIHAIATLRARGRRVPEDVAVIGFDDVALAVESQIALTTMRIPLFEIGRRAADLALVAVQQDAAHRQAETVVMPVELVRRDTA